MPLYSLQDRSDKRLDFKINETEITNFAVGDKIQMQVRTNDERIYTRPVHADFRRAVHLWILSRRFGQFNRSSAHTTQQPSSIVEWRH
ncbi:MAG: hypothetical protein IJ774_00255 [Selenomonadaceae bacterium]|nr:hypothetical protein [Selenomonadaceae bacterium]